MSNQHGSSQHRINLPPPIEQRLPLKMLFAVNLSALNLSVGMSDAISGSSDWSFGDTDHTLVEVGKFKSFLATQFENIGFNICGYFDALLATAFDESITKPTVKQFMDDAFSDEPEEQDLKAYFGLDELEAYAGLTNTKAHVDLEN